MSALLSICQRVLRWCRLSRRPRAEQLELPFRYRRK